MKDKFNLINFGYNPWSSFWKRNQTIFHLLHKQHYVEKSYYLNDVVWVSDFVKKPFSQFRQPMINNWKYILPRMIHGSRIYTPLRLPFVDKISFLKHVNDFMVNKLFNLDMNRPSIVIVNNFSMGMRSLIDPVWSDSSIKIFDWSDDFEFFATTDCEKKLIAEQVEYYVKTADLVLTINDKLTEKAKLLNPSSVTLRNATNYFTFKDSPKRYTCSKLDNMHSPVIGYVGWINSLRLDEDLIVYLAKSRPKWNFIFVGPKVGADGLYQNLSNVHVLDPIEYQKLYDLYNYFDVCIIPNLINNHTDGNDPIKIYDYLATGKPIVSTATSGTEIVKDLIYIAETKDNFLKCIELALAEGEEKSSERISKAHENSWGVRAEMLSSYLEVFVKKMRVVNE